MRVTLLILGCLLFVQFAHPIPVADSSSSPAQANTTSAIFEQNFYGNIIQSRLYTLNGISQVFENVLEKAKDVENPSEELKTHLAKFTEFIANVKLIPSADEDTQLGSGYSLLKQMVDIGSSYENATREHPEQIPENLSLAQNGLDSFKIAARTKIKEQEKQSFDILGAFISSGLTPEETKKYEDYISMYNTYKNTSDKDKWTQLLSDYNEILNFKKNKNIL